MSKFDKDFPEIYEYENLEEARGEFLELKNRFADSTIKEIGRFKIEPSMTQSKYYQLQEQMQVITGEFALFEKYRDLLIKSLLLDDIQFSEGKAKYLREV